MGSAVVLALALGVAGLAEDDRVWLVVFRGQGTEACASDDEVRARVRERIGSEPFVDESRPGQRQLRVGIERIGADLLEARIVLFAGDGTRLGWRTLRGPAGCAALADDLVLAVAIAIDPLLLMRRSPTRLAPAPTAPVPTAPVPTAPVPELLDPEVPVGDGHDASDADPGPLTPLDWARFGLPSSTAEVEVEATPAPTPTPIVGRPRSPGVDLPAPDSVTGRAVLGVAAGLGEGPVVTARVQASLGYRPLDVDAGVRVDLPARRTVIGRASIDLTLMVLDAGPCARADFGLATWRACGTVQAGALVAVGNGFVAQRWSITPWLALGGRGGLDVELSESLGVVIDAELYAPLVRARFVDDVTRQTLSQPALVAGSLGLGLKLRLL